MSSHAFRKFVAKAAASVKAKDALAGLTTQELNRRGRK